MFQPPYRVTTQEHSSRGGSAETFAAALLSGVVQVAPIQPIRIGKDRGSFLERDAVFGEVAECLPRVPGEHISVYTLISACDQRRYGLVEAGESEKKGVLKTRNL
jgi:hypothetical protein